eukprot:1159403-Pelagomonas_calceolata.AAC.7
MAGLAQPGHPMPTGQQVETCSLSILQLIQLLSPGAGDGPADEIRHSTDASSPPMAPHVSIISVEMGFTILFW